MEWTPVALQYDQYEFHYFLIIDISYKLKLYSDYVNLYTNLFIDIFTTDRPMQMLIMNKK